MLCWTVGLEPRVQDCTFEPSAATMAPRAWYSGSVGVFNISAWRTRMVGCLQQKPRRREVPAATPVEYFWDICCIKIYYWISTVQDSSDSEMRVFYLNVFWTKV